MEALLGSCVKRTARFNPFTTRRTKDKNERLKRRTEKKKEDMEQLQDDVSTLLLTLDKPELICVFEHLKCSKPSDVGFQAQNR